MRTLISICAVLCLLCPACGTSAISDPVSPTAEASDSEMVEVTVYDREGLDTLTETLDWAGYEMVPGYPKKLRFGEGWLVAALKK